MPVLRRPFRCHSPYPLTFAHVYTITHRGAGIYSLDKCADNASVLTAAPAIRPPAPGNPRHNLKLTSKEDEEIALSPSAPLPRPPSLLPPQPPMYHHRLKMGAYIDQETKASARVSVSTGPSIALTSLA
ncbi:hypothetical protein CVT26_011776 [Gymnopilus dilepis]|uniref:Uncharacterized protein n=1 Tax=Gymnopilus dilepis TaxID=231916 RepID=A0A409W906_9AGAR|nr:hypothetical protein CVT26_011776 [Gymnopilus dilepis]